MRRNKYNNRKVTIDGIVFDSAREGDYYDHLKQLKRAGIVERFELQPKFTLQESFRKRGKLFRAIDYKADFRVWLADGTDFVVDVKGFETPDFKIKRKLFEKRYKGLELKLVTYSKIDGGWIELDDLKEARKRRKLEREKGKK
ncbi:hypothetical protein CHCC5027_3539 [Bacillus paralicheniformis]|uniref:DUF1064 domain-containing protein n=1 Tax=Bacillus paralicheniformis TaxID=1648923 RepID=UPI0011A2ECC8|nr:DUF1064 domain-containing protein [Bacillus paralicheniformis]TWJ39626.1 hypothetical protein CHCC5027_3539 [Bacillus paralicheniformis]